MLALQSPGAATKLALHACRRVPLSTPAPAARCAALAAPRRARCSATGRRGVRCAARGSGSNPRAAPPKFRVVDDVGRRGVRCAARGSGDDPRAPPKFPVAGDVGDDFEDDDFEDFPGADSARQWRALPPDTRSLITAGVGFIAIPLLLSWSLRLTVIDPLLFYLQADLREFDLTPRQWNEITLELEGMERRLKYDGLMGHAPRLTEDQMEDRLREEGLLLEYQQRQRSREAVGNTLSDTLGTMLLLAGLQLNRARLRAVRSGIAARFLSLEVSSQAFLLLLIADVTVGYHSSDGWVTFVETLVARYNVNGAESVDTAIRLFVATAPVCLDVAFKLWCYRYLRKLSPGTQIILGEIERH